MLWCWGVERLSILVDGMAVSQSLMPVAPRGGLVDLDIGDGQVSERAGLVTSSHVQFHRRNSFVTR